MGWVINLKKLSTNNEDTSRPTRTLSNLLFFRQIKVGTQEWERREEDKEEEGKGCSQEANVCLFLVSERCDLSHRFFSQSQRQNQSKYNIIFHLFTLPLQFEFDALATRSLHNLLFMALHSLESLVLELREGGTEWWRALQCELDFYWSKLLFCSLILSIHQSCFSRLYSVLLYSFPSTLKAQNESCRSEEALHLKDSKDSLVNKQ